MRRERIYQSLVWGAVFLYAFNEFVLQPYFPSLLAGKLSDFAWLFFAPVVVYALFKTFFPTRIFRHADIYIWGAIGGGFILVKVSPSINQLVNAYLWGITLHIVLDPTDIVAIVALGLSFWLFRFSKENFLVSRRFAFALGGLTLLLTLADVAAPDYGIACLRVTDQGIVASSAYASYISQDGGESWHRYEDTSPCINPRLPQEPKVIMDENLSVRFAPGQPIEISTKPGEWRVEYPLRPASGAQRMYYARFHPGNPHVHQGPLDAVIDPKSGNVIFAMGHEGILIRKANGVWVWRAVGPYFRVQNPGLKLHEMLWGEMVLSLSAALLSLIGLGNCARYKSRWARIASYGIILYAWFLFIVTMYFFPPALQNKYGIKLIELLVWATAGTSMMAALFVFPKSPCVTGKSLIYIVIFSILFFAPYVLWFEGMLQNYNVATILSFMLLGLSVVWRHQSVSPPKISKGAER